MCTYVMKDRVYEYILTKEEGVTAVHLNEVFPIGLHKIGGILQHSSKKRE